MAPASLVYKVFVFQLATLLRRQAVEQAAIIHLRRVMVLRPLIMPLLLPIVALLKNIVQMKEDALIKLPGLEQDAMTVP